MNREHVEVWLSAHEVEELNGRVAVEKSGRAGAHRLGRFEDMVEITVHVLGDAAVKAAPTIIATTVIHVSRTVYNKLRAWLSDRNRKPKRAEKTRTKSKASSTKKSPKRKPSKAPKTRARK